MLFDLLIEPLIRWLTASGKGYDIASCDLKLTSKWYADDGTLIANSVEDMISLLDIIQHFSMWSSIHLNVAECKITTYIHALQSIPPKKDRDVALRICLSSRHAGRPPRTRPHPERTPPGQILVHVSHSLPLPGGTPPPDQVSNHGD